MESSSMALLSAKVTQTSDLKALYLVFSQAWTTLTLYVSSVD